MTYLMPRKNADEETIRNARTGDRVAMQTRSSTQQDNFTPGVYLRYNIKMNTLYKEYSLTHPSIEHDRLGAKKVGQAALTDPKKYYGGVVLRCLFCPKYFFRYGGSFSRLELCWGLYHFLSARHISSVSKSRRIAAKCPRS